MNICTHLDLQEHPKRHKYLVSIINGHPLTAKVSIQRRQLSSFGKLKVVYLPAAGSGMKPTILWELESYTCKTSLPLMPTSSRILSAN